MKKEMPGLPESARSEDSAREFLERRRWPDGKPICPHCGSLEAYRLNVKEGSTTREGVCKCKDCRKQFTVTVGTIFESSHIPLHKWLQTIHFMTASKKGMSALQISRMIGVTYKTAWFMCMRLRHSMKQEPMKGKLSGIVEADETYIGGTSRSQPRYIGAPPRKPIVMALTSRNGHAKAFPIKAATAKNLKGAIRENVDKRSAIMTDRWYAYMGIGKEYAGGHHTTNHSAKEYVRGNVHSNTAESYFALLKRGIHGTFHHISEKHLGRYCDEFSFRWNTKKNSDTERALMALDATDGKRLLYKSPIKKLLEFDT